MPRLVTLPPAAANSNTMAPDGAAMPAFGDVIAFPAPAAPHAAGDGGQAPETQSAGRHGGVLPGPAPLFGAYAMRSRRLLDADQRRDLGHAGVGYLIGASMTAMGTLLFTEPGDEAGPLAGAAVGFVIIGLVVGYLRCVERLYQRINQ